MGTQWARKEAQTNELANVVDSTVLWVKYHQQQVLWGTLGVAGAGLLAAAMISRSLGGREAAWSKLAFAQSFAYSGKPAEALAQAKTLAEEHPASPAAAFGLLLSGDILFLQDKPKEAIESYRKALELGGDAAPMAQGGIAIAQEAGGDCKSAIESAQGFLDAHSDHWLAPQVHAAQARCLETLGPADKAKQAFERMTFLYPDTYWSDWAKARAGAK